MEVDSFSRLRDGERFGVPTHDEKVQRTRAGAELE
jgi:hypothetical protein